MLEDGRATVNPIATLAPVLQEVVLGWAAGNIAGAVVVRIARRRGIEVDAGELKERWGLLGASIGFVVALVGEVS